jgi:nitroimidazol reductase NimA-like FMN-containing flavoprotein (pyridoxamine 5'-phosphate oxidase superfamily)
MTQAHLPEFFNLSREDGLALLERNHIGRLAFVFQERVDIEPISYRCSDGWVYCRTSPGAKLATVKHHPWVAFQVDEIAGQFDWTSVVAHGMLYVLQAEGSTRERERHDNAITALRRTDPEAFTPDDLTPHRTQVIGIFIDQVATKTARTTT